MSQISSRKMLDYLSRANLMSLRSQMMKVRTKKMRMRMRMRIREALDLVKLLRAQASKHKQGTHPELGRDQAHGGRPIQR